MKRQLRRKLSKGRWRRAIGLALFLSGFKREKRKLAKYGHPIESWGACAEEATQTLGWMMLGKPVYVLSVRLIPEGESYRQSTAAPINWRRREIVDTLRRVADQWEDGTINWHDDLVEQMREQQKNASAS